MGFGPSYGMSAFFIVFSAFAFAILGIFVFLIFKGLSQKAQNDGSPRLTTYARVVTKRTEVWGDHASTTYYVTFEVDSGDRMELKVTGEEFGMLVEGDSGTLAFQGSRYYGFRRG